MWVHVWSLENQSCIRAAGGFDFGASASYTFCWNRRWQASSESLLIIRTLIENLTRNFSSRAIKCSCDAVEIYSVHLNLFNYNVFHFYTTYTERGNQVLRNKWLDPHAYLAYSVSWCFLPHVILCWYITKAPFVYLYSAIQNEGF